MHYTDILMKRQRKESFESKLYNTCKTKMLALFKTDAMKTQAIILRCLLLVMFIFYINVNIS